MTYFYSEFLKFANLHSVTITPLFEYYQADSKPFMWALIVLPLVSIFIIFNVNYFYGKNSVKLFDYALYLSAISFGISLMLLFQMGGELSFMQALLFFNMSPLSNTHWLIFGVDYISLSLIILTNLFIYLCILSIRTEEIRGKFEISELINKLFFIQWGLVCAFSSLDLLGFFVFFEATLIPIFTIILQGGSRERKTRASYLIALYTLFGSIFMLFNILYLSNKYNTTSYLVLYSQGLNSSTLISIEDQKLLWITFFLAFAAKIPVFPFHLWLPEAHVEAPTIGSVLLAALLLKLGVYGMIRFGLPLFPYGQEYFKHVVVVLTICSFFYTNLTAIRQVDIKKIIAYSSVVHMNLIVLGILCVSVEGLDGAVYQMLAHGLVSGALFFCIGIIYERVKSRFLWYYGGLAFILPVYSIFLFLFILANISFPTTSNFIGEMLLFMGIFKDNFIIGVFAALSMFWGVIYNVWTYNRICFGNIKFNFNKNAKHAHIHNEKISENNLKPVEYSELQFSEYRSQDLEYVANFKINKEMKKRDPQGFRQKFITYYFDSLKKTSVEELNIKLHDLYLSTSKHLDIDRKDFFILFILTFGVFFTGIYSTFILDYITINSTAIVSHTISQLDLINENLNK